MAAGPFTPYQHLPLRLADGSIELDANPFKVALFLSTSNCATTTNTVLAGLTNQHANGNGYTTGGATLASVTWTGSTGTAKFDSADPSWTATGGSITARYAVVYRSGTVNSLTDLLIAYCLLDTTPADVTATDGNTYTIVIHANGIFQVANT